MDEEFTPFNPESGRWTGWLWWRRWNPKEQIEQAERGPPIASAVPEAVWTNSAMYQRIEGGIEVSTPTEPERRTE